MEAEDIRALRKRLRISMKQLADHLGVESSDVTAWEMGERYPTKKHVDGMKALEASPPPIARERDLFSGFLSDPRLGRAVRKLLAHPDLQEEFLRLAERWEDPAE
jgi:transcriptional regulator with XRE-family HTH domain